MFKIKRIYITAQPTDGCRVLVDRIWPRGISKEKARIDVWMKEIAPSDQLRKWFARDPKLTGWSFCTRASERVYITARPCETELGGTREL
jgi:uncharacterized protein YeaO (DUF488 family)